jgi:hypothetical protein
MKSFNPSFPRFTWLHLLVALLLLLLGVLMGCRDQYAPLPDIEGTWRQTTSPYWHLDIDNGLLKQKAKFGGTTVTMLQFTYAERRDTLYIGGDLNNAPRTWVVRLIGENDLKAVEVSSDTSAVWPVYYFERI